MSTSVNTGGQLEKRPGEVLVLPFNWSGFLPGDAALAGVGTFTVTCVSKPVETVPTLTATPGGLANSNDSVTFTLAGGTPMKVYRVEHTVVTNEVPAQTRARSFYVWVRP